MDGTGSVVHTVPVLLRTRLAPVVGLLLLTAACASDGRTLAPVDPHYTTTTGVGAAGATIGAPSGSESGSFLLSTNGFTAGSDLPTRFTCGGQGLSPPLSWTAPPAGVELDVVMRERSPEGKVQWIVTGIDPAILGFGEGGVPEMATEQVNASGNVGYLPPCPPPNTGITTYDIVLHVLDERLVVDPTEAAPDLAARIETMSKSEALLTAIINTGGTG